MVTSISAVVSGAAAPASAGSGLDAELAKCQGQLSDWVHCPSGKTPEGKTKIAEIESRLEGIKARIARRDKTAEPATDAVGKVDDPNPAGRLAPTRIEAAAAAEARQDLMARPSTPGGPVLNSLGGYLDVYA
jgi:hypothetical protein